MGIDVSENRGHDVVCLTDQRQIVLSRRKVPTADLMAIIREVRPEVVAIDSPPQWGTSGKSRPVESQLRALGINVFSCPSDPRDRPFYRWMREGFKVFEVADLEGYERYTGGTVARKQSIEVFPHASAVTLRGSLPARDAPKREWRRKVLEAAGLESDLLTTVDQIDAALAALTGVRFLQGIFSEVGEPGQAVLVLPIQPRPVLRYRRDEH